MIAQIVTENGVKKIKPLTADIGAGAPVGTIIAMYKKSNPSGFLYLDGRDTTGTSEELSTHYPLLYAYLGSNVLPDYREFALVGAEENTTSSNIATHDIYTQGEEKDDQFQYHRHEIPVNTGTSGQYRNITGAANKAVDYAESTLGIVSGYGRHGTVTRGKRKAVYFYIKATSGLPENQQDNVINTLNEERSYSTTEHATGKKWIDGKPIYKKTFVLTNQTLVKDTSVVVGDIGTLDVYDIIDMKYCCVGTMSNVKQCLGYYYLTCFISGTSINAYQHIGSANLTNANVYCTLYYTKTTD